MFPEYMLLCATACVVKLAAKSSAQSGANICFGRGEIFMRRISFVAVMSVAGSFWVTGQQGDLLTSWWCRQKKIRAKGISHPWRVSVARVFPSPSSQKRGFLRDWTAGGFEDRQLIGFGHGSDASIFLFFPPILFILPRSGWGLVFLIQIKSRITIRTFTDGRRTHTQFQHHRPH